MELRDWDDLKDMIVEAETFKNWKILNFHKLDACEFL